MMLRPLLIVLLLSLLALSLMPPKISLVIGLVRPWVIFLLVVLVLLRLLLLVLALVLVLLSLLVRLDFPSLTRVLPRWLLIFLSEVFMSMSSSRDALKPGALLVCGPSKTLQQGARDATMSAIVSKFRVSGEMPLPRHSSPPVGDTTKVPDLVGVLKLQRVAQDRWAFLPKQVRALVGDPGNLEAWVRDPANKDLAVKFGLISVRDVVKAAPKETPPPPPVKEVSKA